MPNENRMHPLDKALWYIESHFKQDIALEDIARVAGLSRSQLSRAFSEIWGRPLSAYMRGRRLSEAARQLAAGAPDILALALDSGYGSHEAFTRAFREQFGLTPEQVRAEGRLDPLALTEPLKMSENLFDTLEPPRFEVARPRLIAGLGQRYDCESSAGIPALWQRFGPHIGRVPGQRGKDCYGVCCNGDGTGNFDYICGVEVAPGSDLPPGFRQVQIEALPYAVFTHRGHISGIRRTCSTIWGRWFPASEYEAVPAPEFELYDERFDPNTGLGSLEIWIPVRRKMESAQQTS